MKKHIRYIIDTIRCHFSEHFIIKNAKVKWVTFRLGGKENSNHVTIEDSCVFHNSYDVIGKENHITIKNGASMAYSSIRISGHRNQVVFDGCSGCVTCIIRGNNCKINIGKDTTMESLNIICMLNDNYVSIGKDCMFSGDVEIWNTDSHLITDLEDNPINHLPAPVTIGNHVWLGKHVKVLKGVNISDNSIVGMSSVVTKDVPNNSIAAGNPAKVIKDGISWKKKFITRWFGDNY